ncbi:C39 family peptidase [Domibacillus iocasae]|uniref:Peptidase C39-like domain-containing protein n=1 Tax=Domibacillus iocasae TaxID=1714016 RepID=A0A1E7DM42_9BACI|nr:C39 family peptidase [Domibacillus iocasae]OES43748.1 hypothetical protein BA724_11665 [Domibacillus iocasae]
MIKVEGQSQYGKKIEKDYRSSACGPVTISVILHYWNQPFSANQLYKQLGATKIGTFRYIIVRRLKKLLGHGWTVQSSNRIDEVIHELDLDHPVAAKFDKYFTFHFFQKPLYKYHWVVLIGYEIQDGQIFLFFHDNGAPGRRSKIRRASYGEQSSVLRFVLLSPKNPPD